MTQPLTAKEFTHKNKVLLIDMASKDFSLGRAFERGASATPPSPGGVYNPDIFWELGNRKQPLQVHSAAVFVKRLYVVIISANATL